MEMRLLWLMAGVCGNILYKHPSQHTLTHTRGHTWSFILCWTSFLSHAGKPGPPSPHCKAWGSLNHSSLASSGKKSFSVEVLLHYQPLWPVTLSWSCQESPFGTLKVSHSQCCPSPAPNNSAGVFSVEACGTSGRVPMGSSTPRRMGNEV